MVAQTASATAPRAKSAQRIAGNPSGTSAPSELLKRQIASER